MKILLLQLLFLFPAFCFAQDNKVYVVLLGGQSNMAGRGQFQELTPENKARADEASKYVSIASGSKTVHPLSYSAPDKRQVNFGPELFIGIRLYEQFPNRKFLLIKEAQGGTSLYGAWHPQWTQERVMIGERDAKRQKMKLFSKHISIVKNVLDQLMNQGKQPVVIGMCWMQGEKDSRLEATASEYGENLKLLIQGYRNFLDQEDMLFVYGQINCPPRTKFPSGTDVVREQMADAVNEKNGIYMISTSMDSSWKDFPKREDNVHYNTLGQEKLGTAFGEVLIQNNRKIAVK
ncbi:sialate O-acetylesterase [Flammeovirga aprica]|uniref:Sialate O-acetylesterase n=1 Tax=Flammeovirga aprica JL-4 TaxID=694437 RepID=A0A7X9S1Q8_9BACT|nr:sialate O-acetylesterase [Flammeovirga aprica]NME72669.1 sialate O-acetylesterase [Flammeovirga aprica JL-4]